LRGACRRNGASERRGRLKMKAGRGRGDQHGLPPSGDLEGMLPSPARRTGWPDDRPEAPARRRNRSGPRRSGHRIGGASPQCLGCSRQSGRRCRPRRRTCHRVSRPCPSSARRTSPGQAKCCRTKWPLPAARRSRHDQRRIMAMPLRRVDARASCGPSPRVGHSGQAGLLPECGARRRTAMRRSTASWTAQNTASA